MNIDEQAAADAIQLLKQEREAIRTGLKCEFPEANQNLDDIVEALGIFIDHHKEREQQLLSALAAIEKKDEALSLCTGISSIPLDYGFNVGPEFDPARKKASEARNIKADLSALREHDAKVRKPLVDLLLEIQKLIEDFKKFLVDQWPAVLTSKLGWSRLQDTIKQIDALTKVKP